LDKKDLPVIPPDRGDDLHNLEIADEADLVLFMAGNQFMAMEKVIGAFKQRHPDVRKIFFETLPPGLELKQIICGGAVFRDQVLSITPDIYTSVNLKGMQVMEAAGLIDTDDYVLYLHNRLSLIVPEGNPAGIVSIADLGRDDVRISQPDPTYEDIAFHIMDMYRQAGGEQLVHQIMDTKRAEGTTLMTVVHHRETPLRIAKKSVDVGPVWATEVIHAKSTDLKFDVVEPGEAFDQRKNIHYYICRLKNAPNPENAQKFVKFITSPAARRIYENYGFVPHSQ
jgi:ABC-type molybdate transport system substrate-binding protein